MSAVTAERLLVATGRRADLAALGVAAVGLDAAARAIPTDGWMRAADGVWAIGDMTGQGAFTHMSMYQADIVVRDILGQGGEAADYRAVPRVTFTDPEIGSVGLTEAQARAAGLRVRTGLAQVPYSARGWIHKAGNDGFIKVIEDADRSVLVGATSAGPYGRRGAQRAAGGRPGRGPAGHAAQHALRLPHVLPGHRGRAARPGVVVMTRRPAVVAFDVIETLMSLEPLRDRLTEVGQPPGLLEAWYTRTLRDGMALSATGDYAAFTDVAEAALRGLTHYTVSDEQVASVMAGFSELPAFPDALPAVTAADRGRPAGGLPDQRVGASHLVVRRPRRARVPGGPGDLGRRGVPVEAGQRGLPVRRGGHGRPARARWRWSPRTTGTATAPSGPG